MSYFELIIVPFYVFIGIKKIVLCYSNVGSSLN